MLITAEAIPMPVATWIAYLCVHFLLSPGWFTWRHRRSPYALRWLPRNGYDLGESAYGILVLVTSGRRDLLHQGKHRPHWGRSSAAGSSHWLARPWKRSHARAWWSYPSDDTPIDPVGMYPALVVIFAFLALIGWTITRRFGWRSTTVYLSTLANVGTLPSRSLA